MGMEIRRKGLISRILCNHDYREFYEPQDGPFYVLRDFEPTIMVCVKCGKGLPKKHRRQQ